MTEQEVKDFIDKVKGKRIRWSSWSDQIFVPNGGYRERSDGFYNFDGEIYTSTDIREMSYNVFEGFNISRNGCWMFVEESFSERLHHIQEVYSSIQRTKSCTHEYIDVGFMWPKFVCKHCNVEKENK